MRIVRLLAVLGLAIAATTVLGATPAGAAITVTTTADEDVVDGDCSLREAVLSITSGVARDACGDTAGPISLPAGTYPVGTTLTVSTAMVINGAGAPSTIIDWTGTTGSGERVFDANLTSAFTISGVTIRGGASYYVDKQCTTDGSLTVLDSVLEGPGSYAVNNCSGPITVERTSISGSGNYGINNNSGNVTVVDTSVVGSDSYGINTNGGSSTITRSTVADSGDYGVNANSGNVTLTNSTVSGAGSYLVNTNQGIITVSSSTIVDSDGFGINSSNVPSITNSIIADTADGNCNVSDVVSGGFNLSDDDTCGFDQASDLEEEDPELGALADNGGIGATHLPAEGSPAVDTGGACPDDDQRALPRPADGDEDGTAVCDRGAVEVQPPTPPPDGPGGTGTGASTTTTAAGAAAVTPRFTG